MTCLGIVSIAAIPTNGVGFRPDILLCSLRTGEEQGEKIEVYYITYFRSAIQVAAATTIECAIINACNDLRCGWADAGRSD